MSVAPDTSIDASDRNLVHSLAGLNLGGAEGAKYIAEALKVNKTLTSVKCAANRLFVPCATDTKVSAAADTLIQLSIAVSTATPSKS